MSYKAAVNAKRRKREGAIQEIVAVTTKEPTGEEQYIISSSGRFHPRGLPSLPDVILAGQIVQAIEEGRWTSTQVVTAFIKSATRAQEETNCITEGAYPSQPGCHVVLTRRVPSAVFRRVEDG